MCKNIKTAHFLIRLLFCLFAEDIGLLPANLFSRLIEKTGKKGKLFAQELSVLFAAMANGGFFWGEDIPHFNGRLFDDPTVLELDSESIDILLKVSKASWDSIEPAVFGTLFERSLDEKKRSQLGAHYTSVDDILLIVEPCVILPLRRRWISVLEQARSLAVQRDQVTGKVRENRERELASVLQGFQHEIASLRILDPACGSGNFLYMSLKALLDLEKEVITAAGELGLMRPLPMVSPEQLHGIEINEYAHELAQVTVWIGYIQWLRDNGFGRPSEPILKPLNTIQHADAILAFDEYGQPIKPMWPRADVVVGNPPFLGDKKMRSELGDVYVDAVRALYEGEVPGGADLVTYWFERARTLLAEGNVQRVGLIATNSIRQRANRVVLERIKQTGTIFMAWSDRTWVVAGAAVRVSMVGFDNGTEVQSLLNGQPVPAITADLTAGLDLTKAYRLEENRGIAFIGDTKKGSFDISSDLAAQMLNAPTNPNGRSNRDVLRPYANAHDVTQGSRGMWIIDFGVNMPEEEAALYELPYEYVRQHVKPERDQVRNTREKTYWWLHARPAPDFRAAVNALSRYVVTPQVSKHRIFAWLDPIILPAHKLVAIARSDDYFLGVCHSKPHELWSIRMGSWQGKGNDPVYTPTTCFETFPFPWSPGQEDQTDPMVQAVAQAARELVEKRDAWLNPPGTVEADLKKRTLTNLYNQRPTWLDLVHQKLDKAVYAAYGWEYPLSDEEILEQLLALNLERASKHEGVLPASPTEE